MRDALEDARTAGLLGGVTIVLHRGAGAYICGEETALLESLEGQRGQPRPRPPFPPVNGLYAAPTQINNVSTIALVPKIIELGAAEFSKIGVPSAPGYRGLLALRERRPAGELRATAGNDASRADLRRRRRHRRRARAEGGHPRRLVGPGADACGDRHADGLRLDPGGGIVLRIGGDHRRRRSLLHGAARAQGGAVLHARVVREVHPLPRRYALAGADPDEARGGSRRARGPRSPGPGLRPDAREVAVRARRLRRVPGGELPRRSTAPSSRRTSTGTAARSAGRARSRAPSLRSTSTSRTLAETVHA